jgi:hypothetical protein
MDVMNALWGYSVMELPVLVAIISVFGTLLGTITGGVIVVYGNTMLAMRKERLELRTACLLIASELHAAQHTMQFALDNHHWWRPDDEVKTEAWEKYKHILASHLSYDVWSNVWLAARNLDKANVLAAAARPQGNAANVLLPDTEHALGILLTSFQTGRAALVPHLL